KDKDKDKDKDKCQKARVMPLLDTSRAQPVGMALSFDTGPVEEDVRWMIRPLDMLLSLHITIQNTCPLFEAQHGMSKRHGKPDSTPLSTMYPSAGPLPKDWSFA
ncbi:hypothetical protein CLAIMM_12908, partial [Cladophialophora immunda]